MRPKMFNLIRKHEQTFINIKTTFSFNKPSIDSSSPSKRFRCFQSKHPNNESVFLLIQSSSFDDSQQLTAMLADGIRAHTPLLINTAPLKRSSIKIKLYKKPTFNN